LNNANKFPSRTITGSFYHLRETSYQTYNVRLSFGPACFGPNSTPLLFIIFYSFHYIHSFLFYHLINSLLNWAFMRWEKGIVNAHFQFPFFFLFVFLVKGGLLSQNVLKYPGSQQERQDKVSPIMPRGCATQLGRKKLSTK